MGWCRSEGPGIQFLGQCEEWCWILLEVIDVKYGRRVRQLVLLQIVVQPRARRTKIGYTSRWECKNCFYDLWQQSGLFMADSHVDIPAPTIVTIFLKPCSRQCASRPSKVNSEITYIKSSCLSPFQYVNLFKQWNGAHLIHDCLFFVRWVQVKSLWEKTSN